ncbi:hypothetical protein EJB05_24260, partial [Eragrostis curvula]
IPDDHCGADVVSPLVNLPRRGEFLGWIRRPTVGRPGRSRRRHRHLLSRLAEQPVRALAVRARPGLVARVSEALAASASGKDHCVSTRRGQGGGPAWADAGADGVAVLARCRRQTAKMQEGEGPAEPDYLTHRHYEMSHPSVPASEAGEPVVRVQYPLLLNLRLMDTDQRRVFSDGMKTMEGLSNNAISSIRSSLKRLEEMIVESSLLIRDYYTNLSALVTFAGFQDLALMRNPPPPTFPICCIWLVLQETW